MCSNVEIVKIYEARSIVREVMYVFEFIINIPSLLVRGLPVLSRVFTHTLLTRAIMSRLNMFVCISRHVVHLSH